MDTKDAYKQKMEAKLELAQAKLAELKAQEKSSAAEIHIKLAKHASELEKAVGDAQAKLNELNETDETAWERIKGGVENAWGSLSSAVRNVTTKSKSKSKKK